VTRSAVLPGPAFRRKVSDRLSAIDAVLQQTYGAPLRALDNKRNPLNETVYILLSLQTDVPRLRTTWRGLRRRFPTWGRARKATLGELADAIRAGGLHNQKARTLKRLLNAVMKRFGSLTLNSLRSVSTETAERELTSLPGLSWKAARCVLLYSFDRDVLPIDSNTFRIMKRAGVVPPDTAYRRKQVHDAIQEAVPPRRRRDFHVNLVLHGRKVCTPLRPRCESCPLFCMCPRIGVPRRRVFHAD
jgi:endonuclease-3